jgi:hypothetical protein
MDTSTGQQSSASGGSVIDPLSDWSGGLLSAGQDPDVLAHDELGTRIVGMAGRLAAATCEWLLLVAEFEAAERHAAYGLWSMAQWLGHYCGLSRRTAVEHLRVARALTMYPQLAAQMSSGRLSYSHARAISRVAEPGRDSLVDDLIEIARYGTVAQLESTVRGLRTVDDELVELPSETVRLAETVSHAWTSQSQWRMSARLDPEHGKLLESAIDRFAHAEGITQAEALIRMAERTLAALSDDAVGAPRELRGDERAAIVVHLDARSAAIPAQALQGEDVPVGTSHAEASRAEASPSEAARSAERVAAAAGIGATGDDVGVAADAVVRLALKGDGAPPSARYAPTARIGDGPGLPSRVALRLMCEGRVRTVLHDAGGSVLDLGRSRRLVSAKQFRALLARDRHCLFPGCRSVTRLEAHHVVHWIDGGRTDMANLLLLCETHHHKLHDGEFEIHPRDAADTRVSARRGRDGGGRFAFRMADGRALPLVVDPRLAAARHEPIETRFAAVAESPSTEWDGTQMSRDYALGVLRQRQSVWESNPWERAAGE